ncbi:unnamed protein product, partial [marine sediment metagenome]
MKIETAIEILSINAHEEGTYLPPAYILALKLGIEALRRVGDMRISPCTTPDEILQG